MNLASPQDWRKSSYLWRTGGLISTNLHSSRVAGDGAWIVTWFIGFRLSHVIRVIKEHCM